MFGRRKKEVPEVIPEVVTKRREVWTALQEKRISEVIVYLDAAQMLNLLPHLLDALERQWSYLPPEMQDAVDNFPDQPSLDLFYQVIQLIETHWDDRDLFRSSRRDLIAPLGMAISNALDESSNNAPAQV